MSKKRAEVSRHNPAMAIEFPGCVLWPALAPMTLKARRPSGCRTEGNENRGGKEVIR